MDPQRKGLWFAINQALPNFLNINEIPRIDNEIYFMRRLHWFYTWLQLNIENSKIYNMLFLYFTLSGYSILLSSSYFPSNFTEPKLKPEKKLCDTIQEEEVNSF